MSAMKEIPNKLVHGFKQKIIVLKLKDRDSDQASESHAVGSLSPERKRKRSDCEAQTYRNVRKSLNIFESFFICKVVMLMPTSETRGNN